MSPTDHTSQELYYAQRASEYDQVYAKPERQEEIGQLKDLFSAYFQGLQVLDVGCGTGYWTEVLSGKAKSLHGFDVNEACLQVARSRSYACPAGFQALSYYKMDRLEGRFEALFGGFIYSHISRADRQAFFRNLLGALVPGGKGMLVDNLYVPGSSTPLFRTDEEGNTFQLRRLNNGQEFEVMKNFPVSDEWDFLNEVKGLEFSFRSMEFYWVLTFQRTL